MHNVDVEDDDEGGIFEKQRERESRSTIRQASSLFGDGRYGDDNEGDTILMPIKLIAN